MQTVDELTPDMGGRWLVETQGSRHEWDLDAMTFMRMPGPDSLSGGMRFDGEPMTITRVQRWPKVGSVSILFYDDPTIPEFVEYWRQSSTIKSITPIKEGDPVEDATV